jgi:hypothetical protein
MGIEDQTERPADHTAGDQRTDPEQPTRDEEAGTAEPLVPPVSDAGAKIKSMFRR